MDAQRIGYGALAGLVGGLLFGAMMQMMGMIDMIGGLVGMEGVAVGWVVHLAISATIGAIYGATLGQSAHSAGRGAGYGLVYGAIWWILGPLLIMPLWMGMPVFQLGEMQIMSLIGHLLYGLATGLAFFGLVRQRASEPAPSR